MSSRTVGRTAGSTESMATTRSWSSCGTWVPKRRSKRPFRIRLISPSMDWAIKAAKAPPPTRQLGEESARERMGGGKEETPPADCVHARCTGFELEELVEDATQRPNVDGLPILLGAGLFWAHVPGFPRCVCPRQGWQEHLLAQHGGWAGGACTNMGVPTGVLQVRAEMRAALRSRTRASKNTRRGHRSEPCAARQPCIQGSHRCQNPRARQRRSPPGRRWRL
jgi:hypothetical protein